MLAIGRICVDGVAGQVYTGRDRHIGDGGLERGVLVVRGLVDWLGFPACCSCRKRHAARTSVEVQTLCAGSVSEMGEVAERYRDGRRRPVTKWLRSRFAAQCRDRSKLTWEAAPFVKGGGSEERRPNRAWCCEWAWAWAWWGCLEPPRGTGTGTSSSRPRQGVLPRYVSLRRGARARVSRTVHAAYTTHYCTVLLHGFKDDFFMEQ
jgi:hypothetical protein